MKDIDKQIEEEIERIGSNYALFNEGFRKGASFVLDKWKEAERWRDVNEELPEENVPVLIKMENGRIDVAYVKFYKDITQYKGRRVYWHTSVATVYFASEVVGWKPIKE